MVFDDFKPNLDRKRTPAPEELRLAGDQPAINLFLPEDALRTGSLRKEDHEAASDKLRTVAGRRSMEYAKLADMSFVDAQAEAARLLADVEAEDERLSSQEKAA